MKRPYPIVGGQGEVFREDFRSYRSVAENGGVVTGVPTIRDGLTTVSANTQWVNYPMRTMRGNGAVTQSWALRFRLSDVTTRTILFGRWTAGNTQNHSLIDVSGGLLRIFLASSLTDASANYATCGVSINTDYLAVPVYNGALAAGSRLVWYLQGAAVATSITGTIPTSLTRSSKSISALANDAPTSVSGAILRQVRLFEAALSADAVLDLAQLDTMTELQP
jgi:hypothetical protein